jgi:hypothetical protein
MPVTFEAAEKVPITSPLAPASAASSAAMSGPPSAASAISTTRAPLSRHGKMLEWCS